VSDGDIYTGKSLVKDAGFPENPWKNLRKSE
jgi:hypothetical protein